MKILVFSDIHGNQYAFRSFIEHVKREKPDLMIFLGDVFGYYYGQEEILTWLRNSNCVCLMGNHDKMFLELLDNPRHVEYLTLKYGTSYKMNIEHISNENIEFLRNRPEQYVIDIDGVRIGAFHGSPGDHLNGRIYPDTVIEDLSPFQGYNIVFLGHTHHKMIKKIGETWIINSGSLGQQRDGAGCSYSLFDTNARKLEMRCVDYDVTSLYQEVCDKEQDEKFAEVLYRKNTNKDKFYRSMYL